MARIDQATGLTYAQVHRRLLQLIRLDFVGLVDPVDIALRDYYVKKRRRAEARRFGSYPGPGNSETMMHGRIARAKSFGLEHNGRYGGRNG